MSKLKIGIMGCSSFAQRAMMPALKECDSAELICVASRTKKNAQAVASVFECDFEEGYDSLLDFPGLDAVYVPLPTGLHKEWCTKALEAGKHLLVEKTFAADISSAEWMVDVARKNNCLIFENFQFQTHRQWAKIKDYMTSGELGDVHLVRSTFGFPPLSKDNFRWNKELGGGALLDAGAYMCKVSQLLLGLNLEVRGASIQIDPETGVDIYGEAMFRNEAGQVAQVAFGFDYFYQCRVELLGTKGKLSTNRVFTAPPGFEPVLTIEKQNETEELAIPSDNHFVNMWNWFSSEVQRGDFEEHWGCLLNQSRLIEAFRKQSGLI